jgi:hypothetical protein
LFLLNLARAAFCCTQLDVNIPKITYSGLVTIVECQNFGFVMVTSHLCRSVELIQCVTVTGVCRIDRNGTVYLCDTITAIDYQIPMVRWDVR